MSILLKATGRLKLSSYWYKGFKKPQVESYKSLGKPLVTMFKGF
jgi:hypothetical protein